MEELNLEVSALSDIFLEGEFEVIRTEEGVNVSFPLPFRLELQFVITTVESDMYDVTVRVIEFEVPLLDLVEKASTAARLAAAEFMADRARGEHRHLYSAHQRALDAFNKCISAEESTAQTEKLADENIVETRTEAVASSPVAKSCCCCTRIPCTQIPCVKISCFRIPSIFSNCFCCKRK